MFLITASAAISIMHMITRRPMRFIPGRLRSPDTQRRRPSTAVRELNEHMFDPRGHSSLALTL
jgi:hypothetical protein